VKYSGKICVVSPFDSMINCPVWFGERLDSTEGRVVKVPEGTFCLIVEEPKEVDLPTIDRNKETWVRALFPSGTGWIDSCDLEVLQ
jgi:hypothetical protein